ncbi:LysR family transcriptional regulator [Paracoccus shanxieyensis]|uniref:LysR family transcriptional regulator n=1 Tax=Paracoccus shanxieyensis TaxID=2675752 RepID=A0A6L6J0F8_9RHOB|nr:LysR family transcriptional regulator [Paracoccus shanxieyensis]MTH66255.1 LysR family transcriptional regulator [Paracoccus shanxieyensis]MTH89517.1 LysR family transcriptional regulator [Paracoccus shanxieyensis]
MSQLTIRQVEVIRAVMMAGTIQGAAELLNVSAPGVSRLVKYSEESLGIRLFDRKGGLFVPSAEAASIFEMIHQVHRQMDNLNGAVTALRQGQDVRLSFASAPSIAQFIAARAIRGVRAHFPDLFIDLNILKIEETVDYLLLDRGEFVVMSSPVGNPALTSEPLATGRLVVIVPDDHPLAAKAAISVHDLIHEDFIGVDPDDPYGAILARPFLEAGLTLRYAMRGRFAQTVVSLVRHGLGVALIDEFSVAELYMPGVTRRPLVEKAAITAWVVTRKGRPLSSFAEMTIERFRREMAAAVAREAWDVP